VDSPMDAPVDSSPGHLENKLGVLGTSERDEFLSEAQEIIDQLSRDLLLLDRTEMDCAHHGTDKNHTYRNHTDKSGEADPNLINAVFRGVHTLKGLCGLFDESKLTTLSHELENTLDDIRLGRITLTPEILDQLVRAIGIYNRLLSSSKYAPDEDCADDELESFFRELRAATGPAGQAAAADTPYDLDSEMLAILTEYEEHRLKLAIDNGLRLFQIRVAFKIATIDEQLEALRTQIKPFGEIITYLPTGDTVLENSIELEVLLASNASIESVREAVMLSNGSVEEMPRCIGQEGTGQESTEQDSSGCLEPPISTARQPHAASSSISTERSSARAASNQLSSHTGSVDKSNSAAHPRNANHRTSRSLARSDTSLRSVAKTVRVDISRLDHLMNQVGDLAIIRGGLARILEQVRAEPSLSPLARDLDRLNRGFDRHLASIQTAILEVRMVPLGQVFEKLARVARQASREVNREVNLVITGAETEVDKLIGEELSDPLMHMIRNSLDHGIEDRETRENVGKPATGTIALNAYQKGNQVVVEVEDDGAGIDAMHLVRAAVAQNLMTEAEGNELSSQEQLALVFHPGLSTRGELSSLSGRGVGMDVVKTNIGRLGGVIDLQSELGIGTKITITLPTTLAMIGALIVVVGGATYALPLSNIQEALMLDASAVHKVEGHEIATVRGKSSICAVSAHCSDTTRTVPRKPPTTNRNSPSWTQSLRHFDAGSSLMRSSDVATL